MGSHKHILIQLNTLSNFILSIDKVLYLFVDLQHKFFDITLVIVILQEGQPVLLVLQSLLVEEALGVHFHYLLHVVEIVPFQQTRVGL